jgi:antitoxin component HigA of HigAB toxin-antitoxin module
VVQVLNRKRPLSLEMIQRLNQPETAAERFFSSAFLIIRAAH